MESAPKNKQGDALRRALEALVAKHNGHITPQIIVDEARTNKKSPLHTYKGFKGFDLQRCAEEHWLDVARDLQRRYLTVVVRTRSTKITVPYVVRDPKSKPSEQGYVALNARDLELEDARRIVLAEMDRCKYSIERARGVAQILDDRFGSSLSVELENMLADVVAIGARYAEAA